MLMLEGLFQLWILSDSLPFHHWEGPLARQDSTGDILTLKCGSDSGTCTCWPGPGDGQGHSLTQPASQPNRGCIMRPRTVQAGHTVGLVPSQCKQTWTSRSSANHAVSPESRHSDTDGVVRAELGSDTTPAAKDLVNVISW